MNATMTSYRNEIKVGVALVVAALILFFGTRFLLNLPLFEQTATYETLLPDASGLVDGSVVRLKGVVVGRVTDVRYDPQSGMARVRFQINGSIPLPEGSYTRVAGLAMFGNVEMEIVPGPAGNPPLRPGSRLPAQTDGGLDALVEEAPAVLERLNTLLGRFDEAAEAAATQLSAPGSDLRQTLLALRQSSQTLAALLQREQQHIARTLENLSATSTQLRDATGPTADSIQAAAAQLRHLLRRLEASTASLEQATASLDLILAHIASGQGTLGRLIYDETLYLKLDTTLTGLNRILRDFETNPGRYLRELRLIDVF
ncbi:MlaD family protein [Rhodothermus marinus]|uniref:Mammalian cell entry related domain protein n=1 Tax=Rhodothermus marinus (strain ATCC 43812 / DSM 4252 / R-10) TaxID=518766 RepID=D0MEJ5_RHOM4|nr:MlaD family protein [Rhodothermus marinus]ACY49223.1 Mammalian cell entry related domain protein [Rhodothermus marinus DSM 4252]